MKRYLLLTAVTASLAFGACSDHDHDHHDHHISMNNSTNDSDPGQMNGQASASAAVSTDVDFVKEAAMGGTFEVRSSQLALQKSQDGHVRETAEMMIRDHTAAGKKLIAIAQSESIAVPSDPSPQQQEMITHLSSLEGTDFDREYLSQQKTAHRETIQKFQTEAKSGSDAKLREFAANTLPTLQHHLEMVLGTDKNMTMDR